MYNKLRLLANNLYSAGTKFIVTPDVKGNLFMPSSIGFVAYMVETDFDYQNVASIKVIMTRRGKGGQKRINVSDISIPIFSNDDMLKRENYLPVERRTYAHIESMPLSEENLLNIDQLDFLGWSCAYATYLQYLAFNFSYPRGVGNNWTDGPLKDVHLLPQRFEENPKRYLREYGEKDFRIEFISKARELESVLIKCATSYKKSVIEAILNSAHFLEYTNKEYYKVADEVLIKNTIDFYKKNLDKIKSMIKKPKNKEEKAEADSTPREPEVASYDLGE